MTDLPAKESDIVDFEIMLSGLGEGESDQEPLVIVIDNESPVAPASISTVAVRTCDRYHPPQGYSYRAQVKLLGGKCVLHGHKSIPVTRLNEWSSWVHGNPVAVCAVGGGGCAYTLRIERY